MDLNAVFMCHVLRQRCHDDMMQSSELYRLSVWVKDLFSHRTPLVGPGSVNFPVASLNLVKKHKAGTEIFLCTGLTEEKEDCCMLAAAPGQVEFIKLTDLLITVLSPWPELAMNLYSIAIPDEGNAFLPAADFSRKPVRAIVPHCPCSEYGCIYSYQFIPLLNFMQCANSLWIHKSLRTVP